MNMMKDALKIGAGIAIGFGLAMGREKISDTVSSNFYKKFYGKNSGLKEDMADEYESAPDVIEVEFTPPEPVEEEKPAASDEPHQPGKATVKESPDPAETTERGNA